MGRGAGAPLFAQQALRAPGLLLPAATLFVIMATFGGWILFGHIRVGNGLAFSPLMTRTLAKVPMELAAEASGILVTNVQLGVVVGARAAAGSAM